MSEDLIKRQDAVSLINRQTTIESMLNPKNDYERGWNDAIDHLLYAFKDTDALPSAQQWIPCSERLPDDGETVLVTRDDGTCKIATFEVGEIENGWQMDSWYTEDNVVAWMPLPEPYKGGEK